MKQIPLTRSQIAIVDDSDYEALSLIKWRAHKRIGTNPDNFYAVGYFPDIQGERLMHRVILGLDFGDKRECDHVNGNGLDNRRTNLRIANRMQNGFNSVNRKNNTSGYKGVYLNKSVGKWQAYINVQRKRKHLGLFHNLEDAAMAYNRASKAMHGKFARINLIKQGENRCNG